MLAAVLEKPAPIAEAPLEIKDLPIPAPGPGQVLLKVRSCGVCRTDLHIVEGELPPLHPSIVPGHQVVADVVDSLATDVERRGRVGVGWLGGTDGDCAYCLSDRENLCDHPVFTGYSRNGGYAEYMIADAGFLVPLPPQLDDVHLAPLLCAGIIGFRSLRVAGVKPRQKVGLFGFGSSAHLAVPVLQHWGCEIYVSTRQPAHRELAIKMGAKWVGGATEPPPVGLDAAVTFAPSGDVVVAALGSLRKGGIVAVNAIHLDRMPEFDYDKLLWGERQIRSVTNMTRQDARDFLALAAEIKLRPTIRTFQLSEANQALASIRREQVSGSAVIMVSESA